MDLNELQALRFKELSELAQNLNINGGISGLNKQELIVRILEAQAEQYLPEGFLRLCRTAMVSYDLLISIICPGLMIFMLVLLKLNDLG